MFLVLYVIIFYYEYIYINLELLLCVYRFKKNILNYLCYKMLNLVWIDIVVICLG